MRIAVRKSMITMTLVAVLVGVLAVPSTASSATDWAKSYCKGQNKFRAALNTASDDTTAATKQFSETKDMTPVVTALDKGLSNTKKAADNMVKSLKKVGAPDIKNGAKLHKAATETFTTVGTQLKAGQDALAKVVPTDTSTLGSLYDAAKGVSNAASTYNDFLLGPLYDTAKANKGLALAVSKSCST